MPWIAKCIWKVLLRHWTSLLISTAGGGWAHALKLVYKVRHAERLCGIIAAFRAHSLLRRHLAILRMLIRILSWIHRWLTLISNRGTRGQRSGMMHRFRRHSCRVPRVLNGSRMTMRIWHCTTSARRITSTSRQSIVGNISRCTRDSRMDTCLCRLDTTTSVGIFRSCTASSCVTDATSCDAAGYAARNAAPRCTIGAGTSQTRLHLFLDLFISLLRLRLLLAQLLLNQRLVSILP
mmetsp:Transcript_36304/g.79462  ORF Transcript_36304/g.79462 Transcript_36304/m.79462 type:complete len:236 (-) Transcript_36304:515-1222(-)